MNLEDLVVHLIPPGVLAGSFWGAHRLYKNHLIDLDLYTGAAASYCYVHDPERTASPSKGMYYIVFSARIDLNVGKGLDLQNIHFVLREGSEYSEVVFSAHVPPTYVQNHFTDFHNGWRDPNEKSKNKVWEARGLAMKLHPFVHNPDGSYVVYMILELKQFYVVLPCTFACMKSGSEVSTINGLGIVDRINGRNVDPIELARAQANLTGANEKLSRLKFEILDFDFLPHISPFKVIVIKKVKARPVSP